MSGERFQTHNQISKHNPSAYRSGLDGQLEVPQKNQQQNHMSISDEGLLGFGFKERKSPVRCDVLLYIRSLEVLLLFLILVFLLHVLL